MRSHKASDFAVRENKARGHCLGLACQHEESKFCLVGGSLCGVAFPLGRRVLKRKLFCHLRLYSRRSH